MTGYERAWVSILYLLSIVLLGIMFIRPLLSASLSHANEPLADTESLSLLEKGDDIERPEQEIKAEFHGTAFRPPVLDDLETDMVVLGDAVPMGDKRIEVDLTNQHVYAYEGTKKVFDFTVSTGKWARTPTGEFTIWAKVKSQKMSGGNPAIGTYYYLPNVPYVMFFSNSDIEKSRGFSLHGAYWHDNFGYPMSHGCINMKISDAQHLFYWANPAVINPKQWSTNASKNNPGTKVIIYGKTPSG